MSVTLTGMPTKEPTKDLLAAPVAPHPDPASSLFAAEPGVLIVLVLVALLLMAAIGRVLQIILALLRQAFFLLGVLALALAAVIFLGSAVVSGSRPSQPAPTATPHHPTATASPTPPVPLTRPGSSVDRRSVPAQADRAGR
jgi:predicted lipid-binding transport protein (Tim44 family)